MTTNEAWDFLRNKHLFDSSSGCIRTHKEACGIALEDLLILRFGLQHTTKPKTYTEAKTLQETTPWRMIELYHKCQILQNALTYGLDIV